MIQSNEMKKVKAIKTLNKPIKVENKNALILLSQGIGQFIQYWGFKEIHGKVWTLLYLSAEPLTAQELCHKLKVSKTLLSFTMQDLLQHQLIIAVESPNLKAKYYKANPHVFEVIVDILRQRELKILESIQVSYDQLIDEVNAKDEKMNLDKERLRFLGAMVINAKLFLDELIHQEVPVVKKLFELQENTL